MSVEGAENYPFLTDAAVQAGNSGGLFYDENRKSVGAAVPQLNLLRVAKAIGSLPENVNFGIKASTLRQFLTAAGLPTEWSNRTDKKVYQGTGTDCEEPDCAICL